MTSTPSLPELLLALAEGSFQVLLQSPTTSETFILSLVKEGTKSYIRAHPFKTTLLAARAVTFMVPDIGGTSLFATIVKFGIGVNIPFTGLGPSMLQTLVGHVVGRTVFDKFLDPKIGEIGTGVLGKATKAGSELMAGLKLWGQQKSVKKVRTPRGKNVLAKKVTRKRKESGLGVQKKTAVRKTRAEKDGEYVEVVSKKTTARKTKDKETVKAVSKKVGAKEKKQPARGVGKMKADAKISKSRKMAGSFD